MRGRDWKNLHINGQVRHNGGHRPKNGGGGEGGREGGSQFQSNSGATKDTKQNNFQLLTKCFKNTQEVYSRTGTRYIFLYVYCFSNQRYEWIKNFTWCIYIFSFKSKKKKKLDIGQKPYWISLFFFALNYKHRKSQSFVNVFC